MSSTVVPNRIFGFGYLFEKPSQSWSLLMKTASSPSRDLQTERNSKIGVSIPACQAFESSCSKGTNDRKLWYRLMMHKPPKVQAVLKLNWVHIFRSSECLFVPHIEAFAVCLSVEMFNEEHSLSSSSVYDTTSLQFFVFMVLPHSLWLTSPWLHGHILLPTGKVSALGALPDSLTTLKHIAISILLLALLPLLCVWHSQAWVQTRDTQCTTYTKCFSGPK